MTPSQESNPDAPDPFVGRTIAGNFRIDRLIGSGATGNVYQAEQLSLGKAVAVKILHPQLMRDEKLVKRFQREAKSASRLNHPNSVQIIESGRDAGTLFIAMELLSGRDLADVIRDEFPLPVPRIIHIMTQVCSALDEAHAHGIIHRDLKPSNIMLIERRNEPDFVKVCDYGIAKASYDESSADGDTQMLTVQGLVCGTPEYMSPEQARGEVLDGRTDLYSAAVILYQMTTGDVPFRAATPIGIVSRHLSEVPLVPSSRRADAAVPADLDDLILRGLAKSRDLRPPTAAIFREELLRIGGNPTGRRALANAKTLPATDPATNGATTSEVVLAPKSRAGRRALTGAVLAGAAMTSIALVILLREPSAKPPVAGDRGADRAATAAPTLPTTAVPPPPPSAPELATNPVAPAATPELALLDPPVAPMARDKFVHRRMDGARGPTSRASAARLAARASQPAKPEVAPSRSEPAHAVARPASGNRPDPPAVAAVAAEEKATPPMPARGPREMIAEGEKLLAEGEVAEACRRGEDTKRAAAKLPAVYKFLGKCYMRAGNAGLAKDNYRRYLELAPNASDAMFIESIVK